MGSDSEFVTPGAAFRKKRKLFSNTPQHSQVRLGSVLQYKGSREEGGSDSEFVTPGAAFRKKRKLFSNTPQHSQVRLGGVLQYKGSREEGGQ